MVMHERGTTRDVYIPVVSTLQREVYGTLSLSKATPNLDCKFNNYMENTKQMEISKVQLGLRFMELYISGHEIPENQQLFRII